MKKGLLIWLFLPLMFLDFQVPATKKTEKFKHVKVKVKPGKATARGAEDVYVLARTVYNSIKMSDFDMLLTYIPNDNEIQFLKDHSTEKDKYLFEEMTSADLRANTRLNFDQVVNEGMEKGINWSDVEIQESKIQMCRVGDQHMCEAVMSLQDRKGKNIRISFDMIKIQERWFLFQGVRIKNQKASAE
jgi:hypothetical protein